MQDWMIAVIAIVGTIVLGGGGAWIAKVVFGKTKPPTTV